MFKRLFTQYQCCSALRVSSCDWLLHTLIERVFEQPLYYSSYGFKSMNKPDLNFRNISSKKRVQGIIMELMEESLENRLKNKRMAFTAENDFTMIPISIMLNWLRTAFFSELVRKKGRQNREKNYCFHF